MNDILETITTALSKFDKSIPGLQGELYKLMIAEIKRLDTSGDTVKVTVKNLSILTSIKNKLNRLILNPKYKAEIKEFASAFNEVYAQQFDYWKSIESSFKPKPLLKAIKNQAIQDTVQQLTTQGISANVSDAIVGILRTNITSGGSYSDLAEQLRQSLTNTPESKGILDRYVKTVAKDSINQFSRQYTQIVSNDLGYEWYRYMNSDIETTRCFCDAMTDKDYFHVSEIPGLLKGKGLLCDNQTVPIYAKTGLPYGMIDGTNAENFFVRAGGWNCGHSIQPVAERQVPKKIQNEVYATPEYKAFKGIVEEEVKDELRDPVLNKEALKKINDANSKDDLDPEVYKPIRDWTAASDKIRTLDDSDPIKKFFLAGASQKTDSKELFRGESYFKTANQEKVFDYLIRNVYKKGNVLDFSKKIEIGNEKYDYGLASYSKDRKKAFETFGNESSNIYNSILISVKGKDGKLVKGFDISKVSTFGTEQEVIVGGKFKYRVLDTIFDVDTNSTKIFLQQED